MDKQKGLDSLEARYESRPRFLSNMYSNCSPISTRRSYTKYNQLEETLNPLAKNSFFRKSTQISSQPDQDFLSEKLLQMRIEHSKLLNLLKQNEKEENFLNCLTISREGSVFIPNQKFPIERTNSLKKSSFLSVNKQVYTKNRDSFCTENRSKDFEKPWKPTISKRQIQRTKTQISLIKKNNQLRSPITANSANKIKAPACFNDYAKNYEDMRRIKRRYSANYFKS